MDWRSRVDSYLGGFRNEIDMMQRFINGSVRSLRRMYQVSLMGVRVHRTKRHIRNIGKIHRGGKKHLKHHMRKMLFKRF